MNTIKIYHDDNYLDVIEKINTLLQKHNLQFIFGDDENENYDGYDVVELVNNE